MAEVFEPATIGGLELPNRLMMAPVKTAFGKPDGLVTPQHIAYYCRRAEGGVGTIIVEPLFIDKRGQEHPKQLRIDSDEAMAGLSTLVKELHDRETLAFAHLNHAGRAANPKASGLSTEAPSAVACATTNNVPEAMSGDRIKAVISAFAEAARRVRELGFDGVELQFGLGYLVAQFLAPSSNVRVDGYGGNFNARLRFSQDVMAAVRTAVGRCYPVIVRISADEHSEAGLSFADMRNILMRCQWWGADALHVVSGSACDSPPFYYQHMSLPQGINDELAAQTKTLTPVPIIVAGRMGDPNRIRSCIHDRSVDFVALGRPLVADPDLPTKMQRRQDDAILACGACLQGCLLKVKQGVGLRCALNPQVGREAQTPPPKTRPKSVLIVGGGPAGIQAAITARERGHRVTLVEQNHLGGQFALAWRAPGKHMLKATIESLIATLRQSDIDIVEGRQVDLDFIRAHQEFEYVIVATGASPTVPRAAGLQNIVTGHDVFRGTVETGDRVLIIGGGTIGVELAEYLVAHGKDIVIVEMLEELARDMEPMTRKMTLSRLKSRPVTVYLNTKLVDFSDGWATIEENSERKRIGVFDTVVAAIGTQSEDALAHLLSENRIPFTKVGDAQQPAQVFDAVSSAHEAALRI